MIDNVENGVGGAARQDHISTTYQDDKHRGCERDLV